MSKYSFTRERSGGAMSYETWQHGGGGPSETTGVGSPANVSLRHNCGAPHAVIANVIVLTTSAHPARELRAGRPRDRPRLPAPAGGPRRRATARRAATATRMNMTASPPSNTMPAPSARRAPAVEIDSIHNTAGNQNAASAAVRQADPHSRRNEREHEQIRHRTKIRSREPEADHDRDPEREPKSRARA
jgi:hypothetical protein